MLGFPTRRDLAAVVVSRNLKGWEGRDAIGDELVEELVMKVESL